MYKLVLIIICCYLLSSCEKQDLCLQYASNNALVRFRTYSDSLKLIDTTMPAPLIVYNGFANQYNNASRIGLSLNGSIMHTTAVIYPDSANLNIFDTLHIYYKSTINFVSKECGYNYFYDIDSVTSNAKHIKKINVLNTAVTNKTNVIHFEMVY